MKTAIYVWQNNALIPHIKNEKIDRKKVGLALCFGPKKRLKYGMVYENLREQFPVAEILICSTAGEIYHTEVTDEVITVTIVEFEATTLKTVSVNIQDYPNSYEAGKALVEKTDRNNIAGLLVFSDGSTINGSELVKGMNEIAQQRFIIAGGLAGDGSKFHSTVVGLNEAPKEGQIVAIALYSNKLQIQHGSMGGWDVFGLEKTVTRSENNVLYEIDNKIALDLYKKYLGPEAESLPGSALLYPLSLTLPNGEYVVRTILSIDADKGSMTFAGDIPEGATIRLMRANFDKLINAASDAAQQTLVQCASVPQLALLISCVGRKLILQSRTEEEVEAVDEVFNHETLLTGFYSYGEIAPTTPNGETCLHNQTMTITTFYEAK